jgi:aminopeptidase N
MTMHALRERIGDRAFFRLTQRWMTRYAYGNATTRQFIDLAERISGQNLDPFFRVWIYTPSKPAVLDEAGAAARTSASASASVRDQVQRMRARHQMQAER